MASELERRREIDERRQRVKALYQQLEAALRSYPGIEQASPKDVRWAVGSLVRFDPTEWRRRGYEGDSSDTVCELDRLARLTDAVVKHIEAGKVGLMAQDALIKSGFLDADRRDLDDVARCLRKAREAHDAVKEALAKAAEERASRARARGDGASSASSRTTKPRATAVALRVGQLVQDLTGKRPSVATTTDGKAYGPFLDLIGAVFSILQIKKASPEGRARAAVEFLKEKVRAEKN